MATKDKITVIHTAEETTKCKLPAYKYMMEVKGDRNYKKKKTACRSLPISSGVVINYLAMFGIICGFDILFKDIGEEYSVSDNPWAIKNIQKSTPQLMQNLLMLQTPLGGGAELNAAALLALIFLRRSRFFYYMTVAGMQQIITTQLRMMFANPRPFQVDKSITPWMCYSTYGNPGDHALAGVMASIVIFLDIFHGTPVSYCYDNQPFHSWGAYMFGMFFALYWSIMMPFTRYLGGIQSVDQLAFGASLGLVLGLFCHFVVRDHLIGYFEKLMNWQNESKGLLNFTKERSDDPEVADSSVKVREYNYIKVYPMTLEFEGQSEENEFHARPVRTILLLGLTWLAVMGLGTIAFIYDMVRYPEDDKDMAIWLKNINHHGCKGITYGTAFHSKMFLNISRITFHLASMAFFVQRKWIGVQLIYNYKVQDGTSLSKYKKVAFLQILNRLVVLALIVSIYLLAEESGQLIKGEASTSIGNRFTTMFSTRVIPLLIIAYLLNAGVYDLGVEFIQKCLIDRIIRAEEEKEKRQAQLQSPVAVASNKKVKPGPALSESTAANTSSSRQKEKNKK